MAAPRVTVLMTTYNGRRYVAETIASILAQTYRDFEFLIIDDASTDDTVAIIRGFADPRIRLLVNPVNQGIPGTRNRGLDAAAGSYLALTDHDDLSDPSRLAKQVAFLDAHPDTVLLGTGSYDLLDGRRVECPVWTGAAALRWRLLAGCPFSHSSACLRLAALRDSGMRYRDTVPSADDHDLFWRLARVGGVDCLEEPLLTYRLHDSNTSRVQPGQSGSSGRRVLATIYRDLFGTDLPADEIDLAWRFIANGEVVPSRPVLRATGALLTRLLAAYLAERPLDTAQRRAAVALASHQWWRIVQAAVKRHGLALYRDYRHFPPLSGYRPGAGELTRLAALTLAGPRLTAILRRARDGLAKARRT